MCISYVEDAISVRTRQKLKDVISAQDPGDFLYDKIWHKVSYRLAL